MVLFMQFGNTVGLKINNSVDSKKKYKNVENSPKPFLK